MKLARRCAPALMGLTVALGVPGALDGQTTTASEDNTNVLAFTGALTAGVGVLVVGVVDILAAPASARRFNERALALAPVIDPQAGRYGLVVSVPAGTSMHARLSRSAGIREPGALQGLKSPKTARLWSLLATLVPSGAGLALAAGGGWNDNQTTLWTGIAGMAAGWILGPSAGHWYAEQHGRALTTTGIRIGLTALGLLALSTVSFDD